MRYRIIAAIGFICCISIAMAFLLTSSVSNYIDNEYGVKDKGRDLVAMNDIIKNSEKFLEKGNDTQLLESLKENKFNLVLIKADGTILYDSIDKNNIKKKYDITKLLAEANIDKQIFTVNWDRQGGKEFCIAVMDSYEKKQSINELKNKFTSAIWRMCLIFIVLTGIIFASIYLYILHPFEKLKFFAAEVAKGNLEIPLVQPRHNIFGAFSWSFDMLRNELKISKAREQQAESTKKELVAVLSHDIRTPIAAIRAYAECLKGLCEKNSERAERYLDVIIRKADEITKLSQDMFLHAISDLEKLEITTGEYRSREILNDIIEPLLLQYDSRITITASIPDVKIYTDKHRLAQVFGNILSNSAKYAPGSNIEINSYLKNDLLVCCFRDCGTGVPPEDLPFVFDKFFRGKNAKASGQVGSGLGLYIAKYIVEKTGGQISAGNYNEMDKQGFAVEVALKIIKN